MESLPEDLQGLFTVPETSATAFGLVDQDLSEDSAQFLSLWMGSQTRALADIESGFQTAAIPEQSRSRTQYLEATLKTLVAHATQTSSPRFIGHMTSALPQFLLPMSKLLTALNQNVVKLETSGSFTPMERQVLAMMHHLVYRKSDDFYRQWVHCDEGALGVFCSGGTVANITALWNARNLAFRPDGEFKGVSQDGMAAALQHFGYKGVAVLVSERGHYSLDKAIDLLGIGRKSLISVPVDAENRIKIGSLERKCTELKQNGIKLLAIIGVAGTTETGSIDPLDEMAAIAQQHGIYFHVDAAWGGASLMSARGKALMRGIEKADSVTIDAHKQMYVPMGAGMVIFRHPKTVESIEHHANYILRRGSKDLGRHSLEGSRSGIAMLVHACTHIIGRQGYEKLIDHSLYKARYFAGLIKAHAEFELISEPQLCILTYRYVPAEVREAIARANKEALVGINHYLNELTVDIQVAQREAGVSFVSRTQLNPAGYNGQGIIVFRVVLANPLTTNDMLKDILQEQVSIAHGLTSRMSSVWAEAFPNIRSKAG